MWRPASWDNPYIGKLNTPHAMALQRDAYEAGADAMLKCLIAYHHQMKQSPYVTGEQGIWVFIPEEK